MWVGDRATALELCKVLEDSEVVGIDTEFAAERRYFPRFDLLQVGTEKVAAAIDVRASFDLEPLVACLCAPERTVLLHSGSVDLAILHRHFGRVPSRVFDTQLAAAMLGYGHHMSYGALVRELTGVHLAKAETLADWSKRPLRQEQIEYALDDVRYLHPIHKQLEARLKETGRLAWFEEEARDLVATERLEPIDPGKSWQRIGAWRTLSPRQLGVLVELANWRERHARDRNTPPRAVLPDDVLVHLARRQPKQISELKEIRRIFKRTLHECGDAMLKAIKRGLEELRDGGLQQTLEAIPPNPPPGILGVLNAVVEYNASEASIARELVCTDGELIQLLADLEEGRPSMVPLIQGWRREVAGRDVLRILTGAGSISVNPAGYSVRLEWR